MHAVEYLSHTLHQLADLKEDEEDVADLKERRTATTADHHGVSGCTLWCTQSSIGEHRSRVLGCTQSSIDGHGQRTFSSTLTWAPAGNEIPESSAFSNASNVMYLSVGPASSKADNSAVSSGESAAMDAAKSRTEPLQAKGVVSVSSRLPCHYTCAPDTLYATLHH